MIDFRDLSETVLRTSNEDALFAIVSKELQKYGYDNAVISTYDKVDGPRVIQATAPDGWAETYFDNEFFNVDPAYKVQSSLWRPHTWDSIAPDDPNKKTREFIGISKECGLKHGVTASASLLGKKVNFATSTSDNMDAGFEQRMLAPTFMIASIYAARLATFYSEKPGMLLSHRERELVQWIVAGLTNSAIASKMNISQKTVEEMLRRISIKNNLTGRVQIAISAIASGQANL